VKKLASVIALLLAAAVGVPSQGYRPSPASTHASLARLKAGTPEQPSLEPINIAPVRLMLTIKDKTGGYVTGLSKDHLSVTDEKLPVEITHFEQSREPVSIGFVFDLSKPRSLNLLAEARAQFIRLIEVSNKANEYFIVGFNESVHLTADLTRDLSSIVVGLDKLATVGSSKKTALYDALRLSIEKLGHATGQRRVIILLSDGEDDGSKLKREELLDIVKQSDVLLYTISAADPKRGSIDASDAASLNKMSSITGGLAMYPSNSDEFRVAFEMLAEELSSQYSLAFLPANSAKVGEWHRLSFKTKPLEIKSPPANAVKKIPLSVRAREGYYVRES
jgi:VWFA-related protein